MSCTNTYLRCTEDGEFLNTEDDELRIIRSSEEYYWDECVVTTDWSKCGQPDYWETA